MKLAVLVGVGTVGTGISLTGAYMLGAFDSSGTDLSKTVDTDKKPWEKIDLPKKLSDFNTNIDKYGCIKETFAGLQTPVNSESIDTVNESSKIDSNFFGTDKKNEIKGCLVVNWNKQKSATSGPDIKWKGDFSLLWAIGKNDGKGFIVFATAEPIEDSGEKKLSWKGVSYSTEKENGKTTWKISKKKEETSGNKKMPENDLATKFPKANTGLHSDGFWGWINGEDDLGKVCGESDACTNQEPNPLREYWDWQGVESGGGQKLGEWTSNLSKWWEELFGKTEWDMEKVVENMTGTWTKKTSQ